LPISTLLFGAIIYIHGKLLRAIGYSSQADR